MTPKPSTAAHGVLIVADDLSGAAESAARVMMRETRTRVLLTHDAVRGERDLAGILVVDTDSRHRQPAEAAAAVRSTLAAAAGRPRLIFKKIDSLLRGNVAAEVAALAAPGAAVVLTPALPGLDRVVRGGVLYVAGVPLHLVNAWAVDGVPAPESVEAALAPLPVRVLDLATVRSDRLSAAIASCARDARVALCDAETDEDLDAVLRAALAVPSVRLAGSGGLADALGRHLRSLGPAAGEHSPVPPSVSRRGGVSSLAPLVVVGSAEPVAAEQVRRLAEAGAVPVALPLTALLGTTDGREPLPRIPLGDRAVVAYLDSAGVVLPAASRDIARRLAETVADAVRAYGRPVDLVLTGGETARRVLDALQVRELTPVGQVHPGAVHSRTADGRSVVTRPGSFGGADSLVEIVRALAPHSLGSLDPTLSQRESSHNQAKGPVVSISTAGVSRQPRTAATPIIAVTMGDGAGVGPEVIVGALQDAGTAGLCRPVVIGDAVRLRQAADILGIDTEIVAIDTVADAVFQPGRLNVIDLGLLPADLPWGKISPVAGAAAYHYVRVASELAMAGEVQAICTAPLNKEALHAGGYIFPGHTELLAHLTATGEVSMMLSSPKIRVIHVTTHIGLIDAIAKIEPGLVERTVRRGHEALRRAGIENPRIGVCGINPHAGENGLFGYGEEDEKIVPAIEVLKADGIDVQGPLPADTAFFVAGRGDYDLIVAMYHDQGHGPVKILGIEAGVNITVGLPVIRTSVDHGTAFDIAGKGVAEVGSMIEALRQAAQMSPSPAS
ncbi:4-hydroxythreonine-4-phosphate dehydrogenase PdxA [Nonomuraea aurantiaca]|uniref:4-hydroxythreonine-4-phosphate dehydrogenase PdxA n=1 Tax=Nonomuraea aurantiaca TaxID=2878562 RepID=UPI001CD91DA0|nr:4-hydroxythreonine-4-phosphate dehydrogenase PdxA [Nonomuraea aurantiaca]MCA2226271.1 4-hydroxythreonine-4-phosphate dehydrogenase PdxA [Nonomuraea aurantiaca]